METKNVYRIGILYLGMLLSLATLSASASTWSRNYIYTNTVSNLNTQIFTNTNTNTNTSTNTKTTTRTCTVNGVPTDCTTGLPLSATVTNAAWNCPERRYEIIYGKYCDHRIKTLRFRPVKVRHAYDGAGFRAGTGLTQAYGVNDNGEIVGQAVNSSGEKHAVWLNIGPYYFENHYFSELGTPRLTSSARAISNEGTIVGESQPSIGATTKVDAIWHSQLGGFALLNALGGNSGIATGLARTSTYTEYVSGFGRWPSSVGGDGKVHGFVWSFDGRNRVVERIGAAGQTSRANDVNDSKMAVGYVIRSGVKNAFRWYAGQVHLLNDYGNFASEALDVNNNVSAKIVGYATDAAGRKRAAQWDNGVFKMLPDLPNRANSMARAITDGGDIVGESGARAAFWRDGKAYNLNALLDTPLKTILKTAIDINRHGRVLVKGGDGFFYLLVPTESR